VLQIETAKPAANAVTRRPTDVAASAAAPAIRPSRRPSWSGCCSI